MIHPDDATATSQLQRERAAAHARLVRAELHARGIATLALVAFMTLLAVLAWGALGL